MNRWFKRVFVTGVAGVAAMATGCITDPMPTHDPAGAKVSITVTIPGAAVPTTRAMEGAGGEAAVSEIDIIVFTDPGAGTSMFVERVAAAITEQSAVAGERYKVTFTANVSATSEARNIVIVANAAAEVSALGDLGGKTKAEVLEALVHTGALYVADVVGEDDTIPMYGEKTVASVTTDMKIDGVELVRMFARVDITNSADTFILHEIRYVHSREGYIAPAWNANGVISDPPPVSPVVPSADVTEGTIINDEEGIESVVGQLYIPEALNRSGISNSAGHESSPHLLVRGTFSDGQEGGEYWYRVDFTDDTSGVRPEEVAYVDVKRNHIYSFDITTVEGRGYDTLEEARASLGVLSNLKTSLHTVTQQGILKINYNGQYWLGVDRNEVGIAVEGNVGDPAEVVVATNYWDGWTIETIDLGGGEVAYAQYLHDHSAWLEIEKSGDGDRLLLTATDNSAGFQREAIIHLTAGRVTHEVWVVQPGRDVDPANWFLDVNTDNLINYSYNGGTQEVTVTSHDGLGGAVPWDVTAYSVDGGVTWITGRPDYLTFEKGEEGVNTELALTLGMGVLASTVEDPDEMFEGRTPKGSNASVEARWNLASPDGTATVETANCYVVDAPGYYRLPLYYGNAFDNPGAYASATFVNHTNTEIITGDPIAGADNVVVVWQDCMTGNSPVTIGNPGLEVVGGVPYIVFDVGTDIVQGNAVIAVRSGATILWSWHLWFTPLDVTGYDEIANRVATNTPVQTVYKFMKYNLGWVQGETTVFYARSTEDLMIRVAQPGPGGKSEDVTLKQYGTGSMAGPDGKTYAPSRGYNVYYQYGRKDPMPNATYYTPGAYTWALAGNSGNALTGEAIQNPHTFYRGHITPTNPDRWDVGNTESGTATLDETTITKSVYDPCPPGFSIPPGNAFRRVTLSGGSSGENIADINVASLNAGEEDLGWWIYSMGDGEGPTVFFPLSGYYDYNGSFRDVGMRARYWTAHPYDANTAYRLHISSETGYGGYTADPIRRSDSNNKREGESVRPMVNEPGVIVP